VPSGTLARIVIVLLRFSMARIRSRARVVPQKRAAPSSVEGPDAPLDATRLRRRRRLWVISDLVVALVLVVAQRLMHNNAAFDQRIRDMTPPGVLEGIGSVLLFTTVARLTEMVLNAKRMLRDDAHTIRVYKMLAFFEALRVAAFLLLFLYGAGVISGAALFLERTVASLSARMSFFISSLTGWIISGVIGNFAYDALKRFLRIRRASVPQSKQRLRSFRRLTR